MIHCQHIVLIACVMASMGVVRAVAMEPPTGLLCNLLTRPERSLITEPRPDFGWIVSSAKTDDRQSAWRIEVASRPELLATGTADLWDSGRVASAQSINVLYAGKPLTAHASYWWRVRTWDKDDEASAPSILQRFRTGEFKRPDQKWPGESRWVAITEDDGRKHWTFEDRPPVDFHPQPAQRTLQRPDGVWFLDFGKAAFATLRVAITWTPTTTGMTEHTLQVAVGEKAKGDAIDPKPGGGIIYRKIPMRIQPGKHVYTLEVPRFVPRYPHSQAMPAVMPEVVPFRYCTLDPGTERIALESPQQLALWVDADDEAASFTCSDPALNQVYDLCKYSVKVNTFNGDYAASERERMMYEADSHIHQMSHYAIDRTFATARYSVENMIWHASWPTEWIPHAIFMAWADHLHTGNRRLLERAYDQLKPKTLLALAGEDGLISTRTGKQDKAFLDAIHFNGKALRDIVDWPTGESDRYEFRDINTVVNAFHHEALERLALIAEALGKGDDARDLRSRADRVRMAIRSKLFDEQRGVFVDGIGSKHASLHANLFPLAFGLVPDAQRRTVIDFVKSRGMACSVYPTIYLLEALYDAGEEQAALDLMTATHDRGWLHMLAVGSTVTTEAWDVKYKGNSGWTHAWSASPAQILPRKLMGITPLEPGFGRIRIQPRPAGLTQAAVRLPTIRGTVAAEFTRPDAATFALTVTIPANMTAEVVLPALGNPSAQVLVDGRPVAGRLADGVVTVDGIGSGTRRLVRSAHP